MHERKDRYLIFGRRVRPNNMGALKLGERYPAQHERLLLCGMELIQNFILERMWKRESSIESGNVTDHL